MKMGQKFDSYTVDYALIFRVQKRTTGQTIVGVTGLGSHATAAAAEFVTSPAEIAWSRIVTARNEKRTTCRL